MRNTCDLLTAESPALWLDPIPPSLQEAARADFLAGDAEGFLARARAADGMELVLRNSCGLLDRGIYEEALLSAFVNSTVNNGNIGTKTLAVMFKMANRERFRELGPLPGDGPFTLYRGISGKGASRRVRGYSWTNDFERAKWFAQRFSWFESPAVVEATVPAECVLAYTNEREESEFIVSLLPAIRTKVIWSGRTDGAQEQN